jgi:iron complex outermembrane receptor protein
MQLRENSPTEFDAGGLAFSQNTTNFDISKKFDKLNVAFGAEFRMRISKSIKDSQNLTIVMILTEM